MLDDFLRDDEDTASFLDEIEAQPDVFELDEEDSEYGFLGMTPGQRFIISLLLLGLVLISGAFCLLITGSIAFPAF